MDIQSALQESVVKVRSKIVPDRVVEMPVSHEGVIKLHALYDFMGLDFSARTGRETLEVQRKVKAVQDYIDENFDDPVEGLRILEGKFGARPTDVSALDHFYHQIRYSAESFRRLPKPEQESSYKEKIAQAQAQIDEARQGLARAREQARDAKELAKMDERLARIEARKAAIEARAKELTESLNDPTPSPTP